MIFVTGGAGFSGPDLVPHRPAYCNGPVRNVHKRARAGNLDSFLKIARDQATSR